METGEKVPEFKAVTHDGTTVGLSDLIADGPAVFFFYPKAFTGGCTAELCHFRDLSGDFTALDATPVGVSRDDPETQASFRREYGFDSVLLSDEDGSLAGLFGAKRLGPLWSKRRTYVVGADGTLLGEISSETDMEVHADRALEILRDAA